MEVNFCQPRSTSMVHIVVALLLYTHQIPAVSAWTERRPSDTQCQTCTVNMNTGDSICRIANICTYTYNIRYACTARDKRRTVPFDSMFRVSGYSVSTCKFRAGVWCQTSNVCGEKTFRNIDIRHHPSVSEDSLEPARDAGSGCYIIYMVPTSGLTEAEDLPSSPSSSPNMLCRDGKP
jgi:hypothetical protein